jgi:hypothetical protein
MDRAVEERMVVLMKEGLERSVCHGWQRGAVSEWERRKGRETMIKEWMGFCGRIVLGGGGVET